MGLPNRISLRGSGDCVEMFRGVRAGIPYWTKLSPEASREILDIKTTYIMNHPRAKIRKYKSGGEAMNISTKSWKVFAKIFDTKNRTVQIAWIYNSKTIEEIKKWSPA